MSATVFEQQFYARTPRSRALFEEGSKVLPGGCLLYTSPSPRDS